jgi:transcriptional pleiotropic repressor
MPSVLLEKTRKLNKILQSSGSDPVHFSDLCSALNEILESNVYILSRKGRILGYKLMTSCSQINDGDHKELRIPETFNRKILQINKTKSNIQNESILSLVFDSISSVETQLTTIIPINCGGDRLGTLIFQSSKHEFTDDDLVLAEYSATVAGMEIIRAKTEEIEEEARKKAMVQIAVSTLSYSELEAIEHIFKELGSDEGLLVASKIADRVGITRSVIVNALRKLESAGVIESRSLGMKGTHIKILNDELLPALEKAK